jgi:hypothetical protein
MKTRIIAQIERGSELLQSLCLVFYPFVEAAMRPIITPQLSGPLLSDEEIKNMRDAVNGMKDDIPAELQEQLREMAATIDKPFTAEDVANAIVEESQNECAQLVRNWLNAYFYADDDVNGNRTVPVSRIDDAMLPPLDFVMTRGYPDGKTGEQMFAECCNMTLDAEATRAVLRQVKATLPSGKAMPDEAIEFLRLEDVFIVP